MSAAVQMISICHCTVDKKRAFFFDIKGVFGFHGSDFFTVGNAAVE